MAKKTVKTPESIVEHEPKYKKEAWQQYTLAELGWWVHLLYTRAGHRDDAAKRQKDLDDARNYHKMMGAILEAESGK